MRGRVLYSKNCIEPDGCFESPVRGCKIVTNVRTLCVKYRDPKYDDDFIFPAKRLKGASDPPNVLRPQDLEDRGGRGGRGGFRGGANFTPRFGFVERKDRAHLDTAGHRMLNHHSQRNQGAYAG